MQPRVRLMMSLASCAGAAASITLFVLGMRALMAVGGTCAAGGAYRIKVQCPNGTFLMVPALFGWLIFSGCFAWASGVDGAVLFLSFASFMLSLAGAFFGVAFPGDGHPVQAAGIVMVVMFGASGAVPLWLGMVRLRSWLEAGDEDPHAERDSSAPKNQNEPRAKPAVEKHPGPQTGFDRVVALERLAELHRRGDLTDAEYELAKHEVLGKDG